MEVNLDDGEVETLLEVVDEQIDIDDGYQEHLRTDGQELSPALEESIVRQERLKRIRTKLGGDI